jgi:hypothetical protein
MFNSLVTRYANILQIRFTDTFAHLPPHTLNAISKVNFFARVCWVLGYTAGRLFVPLFSPGPINKDLTGKVWLYVVSKNNYESLLFLKDTLPNSVFVAGQHKQIGIYNKAVNRISTRFKIFYLYQFLPLLWGLYRVKGRRALRFFDLIYTATGYYEISVSALKKYKPRAIIFANDHNTDSRALLLAAKSLGIKTIYNQHASVSTSFPPLEFDLSLLEGQDALDKYRQCGPISGAVKLIGMPKADPYLKEKNLSTTIKSLGVCANTIDELPLIQELLEKLVAHFPELQITFRPHPSDNRNFSFVHSLTPAVTFSDAKTEPAFAFLKKQDAIIAADSSIHLEATMLNILSIYYRLSSTEALNDYYGYVKTGLAEPAKNITSLVSLIRKYKNNRPLVYQRARYYNAVLGTANEGKSHELAANYIKEFIQVNGHH